MRRGLTLIELLLALGLCSLLLVGAAGWIRTVSESSAALRQPVRWERAAMATLQRIHDDLVSAGQHSSDRSQHDAPVRIDDNALTLHVSSENRPHPSYHYVLDPNTHWLHRTVGTDNNDDRRLLKSVKAFRCTFDEDRSILTVTIEGAEQTVLVRRYRVP